MSTDTLQESALTSSVTQAAVDALISAVHTAADRIGCTAASPSPTRGL
ncbi:hypothetical protein [Streptomyces yanii]|uniref:Uncharacterized protein n=1 Tax=Streptomyces yanii TaxID=78510 RepID=A0ABV5R4A7_9ACTN